MKNPRDPYLVLIRYRKYLERGICLHPEASRVNCLAKISAAHSIQRTILKSIAEKNHVCCFKNVPTDPRKPFYYLDKVGINRASTFYGFCGKHDNDLFKMLEDEPVVPTEEQVFLLGYRAVCRELFLKITSIRFFEKFIQRYDKNGVNINPMDKWLFVDTFLEGLRHWKFALEVEKDRLDDLLKSRDFSDLRYLIIHFDTTSVFFCSGAIAPEADFFGRQLQDLGDLSFIQDCLSFSVWNTKDSAIAVFSWHKESQKTCYSFVNSLLKKRSRRIPNLILNLTFEHCENVYFQCSWWDGLKRRDKKLLERRVSSGIFSPQRGKNEFQDDGQSGVDWRVVKIDGRMN